MLHEGQGSKGTSRAEIQETIHLLVMKLPFMCTDKEKGGCVARVQDGSGTQEGSSCQRSPGAAKASRRSWLAVGGE